MTGTYLVQTFGCQMNVHDSDRMEEVLRAHGWTATASVEKADLVVFNTCSIRDKAEQKLRSAVGKLASVKRRRPDLIVAVAGCMAQQEGEKLLKRIRHVDLVVGPDNIGELPALALAQQGGSPPRVRTEFDIADPRFLTAVARPGAAPVSAFVTTMKGCDERCSFCVVPYTRGPERYRPCHEIVAEIARWVDAGTREIILLGQTVDSYRDPTLPPPESDDPDESQFPALLRKISLEVPRLARLRYTSPHPRHATAALAKAHAELDVLAHHVHLPVQSGSDRVLRRMIRRYRRAEIIERARALLAARKGMTMSTDIIVGFPGETHEDFEQTLSLISEVGFTSLFGFTFSPRPNTPALHLRDDVPAEVKQERLQRLLHAAEVQGGAHLRSLVGTTAHVLFEGRSKIGAGRFQGRTERNEIVHVEPPLGVDLTGLIVPVNIGDAHRHSLTGVLPPEALDSLSEPTAHSGPAPFYRRRKLPLLSMVDHDPL